MGKDICWKNIQRDTDDKTNFVDGPEAVTDADTKHVNEIRNKDKNMVLDRINSEWPMM